MIISNNLKGILPIPMGSLIRVNTAWVKSVEELDSIIVDNSPMGIFLDFPNGRTKPPKPTLLLKDVISAAHRHSNILFFALSNADDVGLVKSVRELLPLGVKLVPKIESECGIKNIQRILDSASTDVVMFDKEDLYTDVKCDSDKYELLVEKMRSFCKKNRVVLLELRGVIFE